MEVEVRVRIAVHACDREEFDPHTIKPGDPLEDRVVDSVAEAVSWALKRNYDDGFCHDLEEQVTLEPGNVEARLVRADVGHARARSGGDLLLPDAMLGRLLVSYPQALALLRRQLPGAGVAEELETFLRGAYRGRTVLGVGELLENYFIGCPVSSRPAT